MAATGLSCVPDTVEIIGNAGRHSLQPFMKGKGSAASNALLIATVQPDI
jgi:hypothetical protein